MTWFSVNCGYASAVDRGDATTEEGRPVAKYAISNPSSKRRIFDSLSLGTRPFVRKLEAFCGPLGSSCTAQNAVAL